MRIVPYYAAALAFLFIFLSFRVINGRRLNKIALGAGGNPGMERLMRVHANFAEYTPFALVLLGMAELRGTAPMVLHGLGVALVGGRAAHAYGVSQTPENLRFRTVGMMLTFAVLAVAGLVLVVT